MKKMTAVACLLLAFQAQAGVCTGAKACEVMWAKAQQAAGSVSNMRIRLLTDSRVETFAPFRGGQVGAVVTKVPEGDGYRIELQSECYRGTDCSEIRRAAADLFEALLK